MFIFVLRRYILKFKRYVWLLLVIFLLGCSSDEFQAVGNEELTVEPPRDFIRINAPILISSNASAYPINGECEPSHGDVTVVVGDPEVRVSTPCHPQRTSGAFLAVLNLAAVTSNPLEISVIQGRWTYPILTAPINDQIGPSTLPSVSGIDEYVGGNFAKHSIEANCSEDGEVFIFVSETLDPDRQSFSCEGIGAASFELTLKDEIETELVNNINVMTTDKFGNPGAGIKSINLPIDTKGPTVVVEAGESIDQCGPGLFTITATDINMGDVDYYVLTSGAEFKIYQCLTNPCLVETKGALGVGPLTLSVLAGAVEDEFGNGGGEEDLSASLEVVPTGGAFVSKWQVTAADLFVELPLPEEFGYNFFVDWGDGSDIGKVTFAGDIDKIHEYDNPGQYTVTLTGVVEAWSFANGGDKDKIVQVDDLGHACWRSFAGAFHGTQNLGSFSGGDTSLVTSFTSMFEDSSATPSTSGWDTANVRDFSYMFYGAVWANPVMNLWDFSSFQDGTGLFVGAPSLSNLNYTQFLVGLASTAPDLGEKRVDSSAEYQPFGGGARSDLLTRGWLINDSGPEM